MIQPGWRRKAFIVLVSLVAAIAENARNERDRFGFSRMNKAFHFEDRINHYKKIALHNVYNARTFIFLYFSDLDFEALNSPNQSFLIAIVIETRISDAG